MKNNLYIVKEGDTLWGLSGRFLGNPYEWPRMYAYNNRPDIVRRTGKGIKDPDLIFRGQKLMLPVAPGAPKNKPGFRPHQVPPKPKTKTPSPEKTLVPFAIQYQLDDLPIIKSMTPGFEATIKLSGSVVIKLAEMVPLSYVTNRGMEMTFKSKTDQVLSQLLSETYVSLEAGNKITYRCNMVTKSHSPNAPSTTIGIEIASDKPVPVLRGEIRFPRLAGYLDNNEFVAMDVTAVIEIEPKGPVVTQRPEPGFRPDPVTSTPTISNEVVEEGLKWGFIAGATLLIGTIVADFLTAGGSLADDPVTIPLALSMMGIGVLSQDVPGQRAIEIH